MFSVLIVKVVFDSNSQLFYRKVVLKSALPENFYGGGFFSNLQTCTFTRRSFKKVSRGCVFLECQFLDEAFFSFDPAWSVRIDKGVFLHSGSMYSRMGQVKVVEDSLKGYLPQILVGPWRPWPFCQIFAHISFSVPVINRFIYGFVVFSW